MKKKAKTRKVKTPVGTFELKEVAPPPPAPRKKVTLKKTVKSPFVTLYRGKPVFNNDSLGKKTRIKMKTKTVFNVAESSAYVLFQNANGFWNAAERGNVFYIGTSKDNAIASIARRI